MTDIIINKEKNLEDINNVIQEVITKKITFKRETLRNLVTIASREYFDSKMKQDELLAEMLDKIINSYYDEYLQKLIN